MEKRKVKRFFLLASGFLALCLVAIVTIIAMRGRIAAAALRFVLPHSEEFANDFKVKHIGLHGVEIEDCRLGGFPFAPSFRRMSIGWTLGGLRARCIDSFEVHGLSLDVLHDVPGFRLPAWSHAGNPPLQHDVLQGWKIGKIEIASELLDFSPLLPTNAPPWSIGMANARVSLAGGFGDDGKLHIRCSGSLARFPLSAGIDYSPKHASGSARLGWSIPSFGDSRLQPLEALSASVDFSFKEAHGIDCSANGSVQLTPCPWKMPLIMHLSPEGAFHVELSLLRRKFDNTDPLVKALVLAGKAQGIKALDGMTASANLEGEFKWTASGGQSSWHARCTSDEIDVSSDASGIPFSMEDGRVRFAVDGSGGLLKFSPFFIAFQNAKIGVIPIGAGHATILSEGESLAVTEASAGFCGGAVRIYALYLNLERLATGFTVVLDNLQFSEAIGLFPQLKGSTATGRLYGRIPLRYSRGMVRLGDGFIYTPPGETGNVKIANPGVLTDLLAQAGLPPPVCKNLASALKNLDYEVFRLDMSNPRGEDGRIAVRLQGKSPTGPVVTPVNLNANITGPIENFLNIAIKTANIASGKGD